MITGKNYIGNTLKAQGSNVFKTFNPLLNEENSWECIEATPEEIEEATALAGSAFKEYRKVSSSEKANFLDAIATEIEALGDVLLDVYTKETGLTTDRAIAERTRTMLQLTSFAAMLRADWQETSVDLAIQDRMPPPKPDLRKTYIPLGPVVVFGASNFPLAYSTAGGDTASALAAGCPVIVKSHPMHAGTGELVASAIIAAAQKTHMPNGVFSNLNSKGIDVGVQLVKDKNVKAVGFTGSIKGGRALFDLANDRPIPIPVFAEMGSVNPVIISQKSLELESEKWAVDYANSINLGTGQFCTSPGLILGVKSVALDGFGALLADKISELKPTVMLHPNIKNSFLKDRNKVISQDGVELISKNKEVKPNHVNQTVVYVNGNTFINNPTLHHEVFGPFSILVKCADLLELEEVVESLEGQLTGTIIAKDDELESLSSVIEEMQHKVGRIIYNGVSTGVEVCESMNHGGPYPASTDSRFTAVGVNAIKRWLRPISYQNFPQFLLPDELKD